MKKKLIELLFGKPNKIESKPKENLKIQKSVYTQKIEFNDWVMMHKVSYMDKERLDYVSR
jgi:hypothetical protein